MAANSTPALSDMPEPFPSRTLEQVLGVRDYSWVTKIDVISESRAFRLVRMTRGGRVQYAVLVWDESEQDYVSGGEMSAADMQTCLLGAATALTHLK